MPRETDRGAAIPEATFDQAITAGYAPQTARLVEDFENNHRVRSADESVLLDERNETDQFHFVFVRIGWRRPVWDRTAAGPLKSLLRGNCAGLR